MHVKSGRWMVPVAVVAVLVGCGGDGGTTDPPLAGTVSGTVTADGDGIGGVQVNLPGMAAATTSADGRFSFTAVTAGSHTLTITVPDGMRLSGTETAAKTVSVVGGQTHTVNWTLESVAPGGATVDTVRLVGTSFQPSSLTVKTGSTIVWVNTESMVHTVTPDGHSQWTRAETSSPGEVTRATIDAAGTYEYYCEPHRSAGMTGQIVVQP